MLYLIQSKNDDTEPMLVGVAESMAKAVLMQEKLMSVFEDAFEYDIVPFKLNNVTIDDVDYSF